MPRRETPDPVAAVVGRRIKQLRLSAGLTLEKLAYESALRSKGHLSDVEKGLSPPTVTTLHAIAERLGVPLADLVLDPGADDRQLLFELTRQLDEGAIRSLVDAARRLPPKSPEGRSGSVLPRTRSAKDRTKKPNVRSRVLK